MDNYTDFTSIADLSDMTFTDFNLVTFGSQDDGKKTKKKKTNNKSNLYEQDFAHDTLEYYKAMLVRKMDPITMQEIDPKTAFEFKYMWDPYTGERTVTDPYGSLWFDPNILIKFFHTNRLNELWVEPKDETDGYYQGYYADALGRGSNMYIQSRGFHPERYLFRLPIVNCYLTKDHNESIITMGPVLTNEEITKIDDLAAQTGDLYKQMYRVQRPNLALIKYYYDEAISMTPTIINECNDKDNLQSFYDKANRIAVDKLKVIRG